jgi:uncharacterized protein YbjT (DUF2867 family)
MKKTAIVLGASGLVGSELVLALLAHEAYDSVVLLLRRPSPMTHPKLHQHIVDFEHLYQHEELFEADELYIALGTTLKKAGSKEAFRQVDYEYVAQAARLGLRAGIPKLGLVSAVGADKSSFFFYNQVKGEAEAAVLELDFEQICIVRPSLLLGDRSEERTGEDAAKVFDKIFNPLIPSKYRGIEASKVAKALIQTLNSEQKGATIIESDALQNF